MPPSYSPCPRPILKRHSASQPAPAPRDEPTQLLAIDPSVLTPLVRFSSSTRTLGSAPAYDRSPIVVLPNRCNLPERGCPGRTYAPDEARAPRPARVSRQHYPRPRDEDEDEDDELTPRPTPLVHHHPLPPLIPDLSSESSEESDGFAPSLECIASAPSIPHAKLSPSGPALAFLPHAPPPRPHPHSRTHSPARSHSPSRPPHTRRRSRQREHDDPDSEADRAFAFARYKALSDKSVLHALAVPDLGCFGGF